LNDSLNFFNSFLNHNLRDNSFDNLRNLYNFLDDTRYDYYFLNYFLDFHYLWYLDHLFNYFLYWYFDLFYSINMSKDFNYLLLDVFDRFRYFDVVIDYLFNLYSLRLPYNNRISNLNNDWNLSFNNLDARFLNNFLYF